MDTLLGKYKLVLGLEIHMHLKVDSKMFCSCDANIYEAAPNTHVCPTCLGLPGALPVPNFEAIRKTQLLGLALNCMLNTHSRFDRKHYFYPDLAKGYQISQYKQPFCVGTDGVLERIHLEEDTAKSFHEGKNTLIDFNKSGMPLIEIVTKPVFKTAESAMEFAKNLRDIAKFLNISDCDMEKGQMRIEPNISIRTMEMEDANQLPNYKVEVKNINSFRFMEKAVNFEITRQRIALDNNEVLTQENRGYDEKSNSTVAQRSKEEAHDYRYFPDPDIPPFFFDEKYFADLLKELPELPHDIMLRLIKDYNISPQNAKALTQGIGIELLSEFELHAKRNDPNTVANVLLNKLDYRGLTDLEFDAKFADMGDKIDNDSALLPTIVSVLENNVDAATQYKLGKESILQFLVGQVMRETRGKADAQVVSKLLKEALKS